MGGSSGTTNEKSLPSAQAVMARFKTDAFDSELHKI
jgi:hypothetical protein